MVVCLNLFDICLVLFVMVWLLGWLFVVWIRFCWCDYLVMMVDVVLVVAVCLYCCLSTCYVNSVVIYTLHVCIFVVVW